MLLFTHVVVYSCCCLLMLLLFTHVVVVYSCQGGWERMRIAIIGQSQFAADVYQALRSNGHMITGVFTVPDKEGRVDPLGK